MIEEPKVADMVKSIKGIATTLEVNNVLSGYSSANELVGTVKNIYLKKIDAAIASSKFNKAQTPEAIKKANDTKEMLFNKSREIADLFL